MGAFVSSNACAHRLTTPSPTSESETRIHPPYDLRPLSQVPIGRYVQYIPPRCWRVTQTFVPLGSDLNGGPVEWFAVISIVVMDLPLLLRQGFYWNMSNVNHTATHIICAKESIQVVECGWDVAGYGYQCGRRYFLSSRSATSAGGMPTWTAMFDVLTRHGSVLGDFRLEDLSPDNICQVWAWDPDLKRVCDYDSRQPSDKQDTVSDGREIEPRDWWPRRQPFADIESISGLNLANDNSEIWTS